ncbi:glucosylglycerol 3-phosphatase [Salinicola endophyticus]|uniref:glucosylglycerol 3-phosphatase n=1 Tax=Salinicola endophyticus TaxID=1949083 RepID=UPI001CB6F470|nr:glucosylglycerol 3-phosphatase [Salinicola endophyticus]
MTDPQRPTAPLSLAPRPFALDHAELGRALAATANLLIIQDLDGVCMALVDDPLTRQLPRRYLDAAGELAGHFFVLTNGEHVGARGVNALVEAHFSDPAEARRSGRYLPGLAAGGVQWQDRFGRVSHPGVSAAELDFLARFPAEAETFLDDCLARPPFALDAETRAPLIASAVLDNLASPTLNLNVFRRHWQASPEHYWQLQEAVVAFMQARLAAAEAAGLEDAFFIHYAPNAGRDDTGQERPRLGTAEGTTDFQLMLRGAVKESGVLAILNRYYQARTGVAPLGETFDARQAPRDPQALLALAREHFDPALMPTIVGVGDTLTSVTAAESGDTPLRGGSDRGFLTLVQQLGDAFERPNRVLFVDSSGGEVARARVDAERLARHANDPDVSPWPALAGISDPDDPLRLDVIFPGGHTEYVDFFCELARQRRARV